MFKRFLRHTFLLGCVYFAAFQLLGVLLFALVVFFFTEEGPSNVVEMKVIPFLMQVLSAMSWPGESASEFLRVRGLPSIPGPVIRCFVFAANGVLWGAGLSLVRIALGEILQARKRKFK